MFKKTQSNILKSDEGFTIEMLGRAGLKYVEGNKEFLIDSELLVGSFFMVIYKESITAVSDKDFIITEKEKNRIIENIKRSFLLEGLKIDIL